MIRYAVAAMALATASAASAEVVSADPHGFVVREAVTLVVPPDVAYRAFANLPRWWNKEHTYSGDAANLSLSLTPGGCLCERFPDGGGIEHLRVAAVTPGKSLVLTGALGPVLYEAANGVMVVKFERIAGGSRVTLDYRAAGFAAGGADQLAPAVDAMLGDQIKRFRRFAAVQSLR
jgi:uncharacterized protein YndB with AHSA1/START domain